MSQGRRRVRRSALALLAAVSAALIGAGSAGAATEIGTTFDPGTSFCGNLLLQSVSPPTDTYAAPSAGVVTSWSYQASSVPVQLQLKIGRAAGTNQFTIVGESAVETASSSGPNTFQTRIPVQAGDLIGLRPVSTGPPCIRGMSPGYSYSAYVMGNDLSPGTTATFNPPNPNVQMDVAANLEPDADTDGFGDETQDRCLGVPGPMEGCPSNTFTFGKLKRNAHKGTAVLIVSVPGPGELTGSGTGVSAASAAAISKSVGAAGDVTLLIKAKGKKKRKLNETGKVKVSLNITFTPTGGLPSTQPRTLSLRKKVRG
jgi:hypothetical protein